MKIKVVNGPNMNMLGIRERDVYGARNYDGLCAYIREETTRMCGGAVAVDFFQSNSEGALIDCLHACYFEGYDGVVINPGAYTHYSYAIADALRAIRIPAVEVHISDIASREPFRRVSVTKDACVAQICGKGFAGYTEAIALLASRRGEKA